MSVVTNPILKADSYKAHHSGMYSEGIVNMWAYGEPRVLGYTIVPFGLTAICSELAKERITKEHVDEAQDFIERHIPGTPWDRKPWDKIVSKHGGRWPVLIQGLPEGLPVPSSLPIYTITLAEDDPELAWLPAYIETRVQRAIWYPTTIATLDHGTYTGLHARYEKTGANKALIPFALHDFGGRGVTCSEQAEIGGAAHLVHFDGSDTMEGIYFANRVYKHNMAGYSVPATEHSIQCSYGPENQVKYLSDIIAKFGKPGGIVSLVIDGYDTYQAVKILCEELKDQIIASGAKVVFRPDSGDMVEQTLDILKAQCEAFGFTETDKGYKTPKHVGILWGDGVDRGNMLKLLDTIAGEGYAADCVVFGSGGALLQKVNRDTLKFAQKTSAVKLPNGAWMNTQKMTPGKVSKGGRISTKSYTNDWGPTLAAYDIDVEPKAFSAMFTYFAIGMQPMGFTMDDIRKNARV